jgi:hypothetical protein
MGPMIAVSRIDFCPNCGCELEVRSNAANAKLHAMLTEISHRMQWAGQTLDVESWKRLFIAAFAREKKQGAQFFPAIDGQGFDVVYRRSSRMGKREMIELIDWITAWCAQHGIEVL